MVGGGDIVGGDGVCVNVVCLTRACEYGGACEGGGGGGGCLGAVCGSKAHVHTYLQRARQYEDGDTRDHPCARIPKIEVPGMGWCVYGCVCCLW